MNWAWLRRSPWLDTRARFVAQAPLGGALLDLGSSDGETLGHIAELRPDLRLFAADVAGQPQRYPPGCQFQQADLERERLPWPDGSIDVITCMHLVEHLHDLGHLLGESARLLKPGGRIYFETPHPKTVRLPSLAGVAAGTFTFNFFDDPGHVRPVPIPALAELAQQAGLAIAASGTSRNWLFALAYPFYKLRPPSRQKHTARVHWIGWSAWLEARKP
jgi:SAM-dependent methyltransferase